MGVLITGDNNPNEIIQGNRSEIVVDALGGNDTIILNLVGDLGGGNFVDAGSGDDFVDNRFEGGNEIRLGTGNDTYISTGFALSGMGFDSVFGGSGDDMIAVTTFHSEYFGEADNDTFVSEGWQNFFSGGSGNDTLSYELRDESSTLGGSGIDIDLEQNFANTGASRIEEFSSIENATGTNVSDDLFGSSVDNVLKGRGGIDLLVGRSGNDTLDGGTSADEMVGGSGNDTYIVQDNGDIVDELNDGGSGTDSVQSSISFSLVESSKLGGVVERLTLTGSSNVNGTGNGSANTLTGNTGANLLNGGSGNDTINGGSGNDSLDGSTGTDSLIGSTGNDSYIVDSSTDVISETTTTVTEIDSVTASVSFTLGSNLESLTLTGSTAINGTGNTLANTITGNTGANLLSGGSGNDTLTGGAGNDALNGGSNNDRFVLSSLTGSDTISDFVSATDKLVISQAGISVGDGNTTIGGGVLVNGPGGFASSAELVVISGNIAGAITTASAAAKIGSATSAYAEGRDVLFAVDNGTASALYLFTAADANALVSSSELTLLATLTATPQTAVADFIFGA
jgi:Ca2+-binding RTX toxin-like protein